MKQLQIPDGPSLAGWHKVESGFRCYKEYQYEHIRGVTNPKASTPDPFTIGQLMHYGKAHWFLHGFPTGEKKLAQIRDAMLAKALEAKLPMSIDAQRRALRYFTEYVEHWRVRPRPKVVAAEYDLGPVALRETDELSPFLRRTARLDDVSYYPEGGNRLFIGESKTTSTSAADALAQYQQHGQPLLQLLLWKAAPQGEKKHGPVGGVMLDVIVKGSGERPSTFSRVPLPITQRQLDWFEVNFRHTLRILNKLDWNSNAPRNITACTRMYGRARVTCPYLKLCQHGRSATGDYVLPGGKSLAAWKPNGEQEVPPWE